MQFIADETCMGDRRFESRQATSDVAVLRLEQQSAPPAEYLADIAEISQSGMRLKLKRPVPVHTRVTITQSNQEHRGKVRYCVAGPGGFVVGVQFENR